MTPEQQAAIAAAQARRRAGASPSLTPAQQAAVDAARARRQQEAALPPTQQPESFIGREADALRNYVEGFAKPPPEPVTTMGVVDQGMRGVAQGALNVLGAPRAVGDMNAAAVDWLAKKAGASDPVASFISNMTPLSGLRSLPSAEGMGSVVDAANNATADALGVDRPNGTPGNMVERAVNRIGQEIGGAALPVAAAGAKAASLSAQYGPRAAQAARESGGLTKWLVEPYVVAPRRAAINDMTYALAGGQGAAVANEIAPDSQVADTIGALAGAGGLAVTSGLAKSLFNIGRAATGRPGYVDSAVREGATDRLVNASGISDPNGDLPDTTDLVQQIMDGDRIGDVVPGVRESLADRTKNPGIAALEYGRQTGPNSGQFTQRRADNARAIEDAIMQQAPDGNPGMLRSELMTERDRRLLEAQTAARNASEDATNAVQSLMPTDTPAVRGNIVRGALDTARENARQATQDAYAAAATSNVPIDPTNLSDVIEGRIATMTQAERQNLPEGLLNRIRQLAPKQEDVATGLLDASGNPMTRASGPADPIRMKEATDLLSTLKEAQRNVMRYPTAENGGRNASRVLGELADTVDAFITQNLDPEQAAALDAARSTKFTEAQGFGRTGDPVAAALGESAPGVYKVRDDRVAGLFTNPQNMERLFAQADTPEVRQAIRDEILSKMDGTNAKKIENFVASNNEALSKFPGLSDQISAAAKARAAEAGAAENVTGLERSLGTPDKQGTSAVGKYLAYGDENARKAMRGVIASKDPAAAADELLNFADNTKEAVAGARRAFWDLMESKGKSAGATTMTTDGTQPWKPAAVKRFLEDPATSAVAERLYKDNPEHLLRIKQIVDTLQGLDMRSSAKAPATSGTAQSILPSAETIASRSFAVRRGQVGVPFAVGSIVATMARRGVKFARQDAIEKMLDDVLLDPDAAAKLLAENNPANRAALKRWSKLWFGNDAAKVMNSLSADDTDPTTEAINGRP